MAYDLLTRKHNKTDASRMTMRDLVSSSMGEELRLSPEDRNALVETGNKFRKAGLFIFAGLVIVSFAEVIAHRNMSFRGDGFFQSYKSGRGQKF